MAENKNNEPVKKSTWEDKRTAELRIQLGQIADEITQEGEGFLAPLAQEIRDAESKVTGISQETIDWTMQMAQEWVEPRRLGFLEKIATELGEVGATKMARQVREISDALPYPCLAVADFERYIEEYDPAAEINILGIGRTAEGGFPLLVRPGSFNVIGARPGIGKTSALISITNENLLNIKRGDNGAFRRIVFVSLEEAGTLICQKLILCRMYRQNHYYINAEGQEKERGTSNGYITPPENPTQDFWAYHGKGYKDTYGEFFREKYEGAAKEVLGAIGRRDLKIYDETSRKLSRVQAIIKQNPESLVLVDYIQRVDPILATGTTFKDMKDICTGITGAAQEYKCTVIAGAQLNRNFDTSDPEKITDNVMREGDDILTCAEAAIVLGGTKDAPFWYILKNRNGGGKGSYAALNNGNGYFCLWNACSGVSPSKPQKENLEEYYK